jgi:hypothetical protein
MPRNPSNPAPAPRTFLFDGAERTVAEIRRLVPALSETSIRKHLAAGRNTTAALLCFRQTYAPASDASRYPHHEAAAASSDRRTAERARARAGMRTLRARRADPAPDD